MREFFKLKTSFYSFFLQHQINIDHTFIQLSHNSFRSMSRPETMQNKEFSGGPTSIIEYKDSLNVIEDV